MLVFNVLRSATAMGRVCRRFLIFKYLPPDLCGVGNGSKLIDHADLRYLLIAEPYSVQRMSLSQVQCFSNEPFVCAPTFEQLNECLSSTPLYYVSLVEYVPSRSTELYLLYDQICQWPAIGRFATLLHST